MSGEMSQREFVSLMALLTSLAAMAIDAMLPALGIIASDLGVTHRNDAQFVVSALLLGMGLGQLVVGPLGDSLGRKPTMYIGMSIFVGGTFMSIFAGSFAWMIAGRALQGVGAAAPRTLCVAIVRDLHAGKTMARIMSVVMAIFILVPVLAPLIGQAILAFASWRAIFVFLLFQSAAGGLWFALRQRETLDPDNRRPFSARAIAAAASETLRNRTARGYTAAAGLTFGAFVGYLSSVEQIFHDTFDVGDRFSLYFGGLAVAIGAAAIVNSRVVERLGMRTMCWRALLVNAALSSVALALLLALGDMSLLAFMAYMLMTFFAVGVLFGNFNALATEPLGHIAGTAASVIGFLTTMISLALGASIGQAYDGTVVPLVAGFAVLSVASLIVMAVTEGGWRGWGGWPDPAVDLLTSAQGAKVNLSRDRSIHAEPP